MYTTNNPPSHQPYNPPYVPARPPHQQFAEPSHAHVPSFVTPAIASSGSAGARSTAEGSAESIDPRLKTAGIAILVSAAVLLIGMLTKSWFTATGGKDGGLGLLGLEACRKGVCHSVSWFDVPRVPSEIPIFATTALIACAATFVLLVHTGAKLLQGNALAVRLHWLIGASTCAILGSVAFVATMTTGTNARGLSLGWSTIVAFAGLLATAITTLVVVRPLTQQR